MMRSGRGRRSSFTQISRGKSSARPARRACAVRSVSWLVCRGEHMLVAFARGALGALAPPMAGAARTLKGKVLRKPMWDGWPRFSPDGWPYARHMKRSRGEKYMTKQAWRRINRSENGA